MFALKVLVSILLKNSIPKFSKASEKTPLSLNKLPSKPPTDPRSPNKSPNLRELEEEPMPRKDSISLSKKPPRLPPRKSEGLS